MLKPKCGIMMEMCMECQGLAGEKWGGEFPKFLLEWRNVS